MPHQCVHCGEIYPDACEELLKGCSCGARFFYYIRQEKADALERERAGIDEEVVVEEGKVVEEKVGIETDEGELIDEAKIESEIKVLEEKETELKEKFETKIKELKLESADKEQIEKDIREISGLDEEPEKPVILDLESVRTLAPGKFEIDILNLFSKKRPLIYRLEEGKYIIDLASSLEKGSLEK